MYLRNWKNPLRNLLVSALISLLVSGAAAGSLANDAADMAIGAAAPISAQTAAREVAAQATTEKVVSETPLVEEEYIYLRSSATAEEKILPYSQRRGRWGTMMSLGYSTYSPTNYQPNFAPAFDFDGLYGPNSSGMPELNFASKMNFPIGALQFGLGVGFYSVSAADDAPADSSLSVTPVRAEVSVVLDALSREPLFAPYGFFGVYTSFYREEQGGVSVNGNTQAALYYGVGINLQLNWLERPAAERAYLEYGVENTFLYIEGRAFQPSSLVGDATTTGEDPDFSTDLQVAGGLRIEL